MSRYALWSLALLAMSGCDDLPRRHFPPLEPTLTGPANRGILLLLTRVYGYDDAGIPTARSSYSEGRYVFARLICDETGWINPSDSIGRSAPSRASGIYAVLTYGSDFRFPRPSDPPPEETPPAAAAVCSVASRGSTQPLPCGSALCIGVDCYYEAPLDCETFRLGLNPFFGAWSGL